VRAATCNLGVTSAYSPPTRFPTGDEQIDYISTESIAIKICFANRSAETRLDVDVKLITSLLEDHSLDKKKERKKRTPPKLLWSVYLIASGCFSFFFASLPLCVCRVCVHSLCCCANPIFHSCRPSLRIVTIVAVYSQVERHHSDQTR